MFIRPLARLDMAEQHAVLHLSDNAPAVIAFEDKIMANRSIFYLGRIAADDFGEVIALSGNGRGFGAFKIVRGMYERLVQALYMAQHPSESRSFVESSSIAKLNYISRMLKEFPEIRNRYNDEFMAQLRASAAAARAKRKKSICPKCSQPVTQQTWAQVSLDVMAKEVEPSLEVLYPQFYLEGTQQSHANIADHHAYLPDLGQIRMPVSPSNVRGPKIKRTNSYDVKVHVERAKHGIEVALDVLYVTFDPSVGPWSFAIEYVIHASNLPAHYEWTPQRNCLISR